MWSAVYQRGDSNHAVVWCVSGPGIHGKLQSLVRWRTVGQTTNVAEDGVTSGYGAEYAWQICAACCQYISFHWCILLSCFSYCNPVLVDCGLYLVFVMFTGRLVTIWVQLI